MASLKDLLVAGPSRFIGKIYASDQFISNVAQGTAPFAVDSSTLITNLNADLLDGKHLSDLSLGTHQHYWANLSTAAASSTTTTPQFGAVGINTAANTTYRLAEVGDASITGTLLMHPTGTAYNQGIRIYPTSSWSLIMLLGTDTTATTGTSTKSWGLFNKDGNFYINKNACDGAGAPRLWGHANGWTIGNTTVNTYNFTVQGNVSLNTGLRLPGISAATADFTDGTQLLSSYASNNGFADTAAALGAGTVYKRPASAMWNYIKTKATAGLYWANIKVSASSSTATIPTFKSIVIDSSTAGGSNHISFNRVGWSYITIPAKGQMAIAAGSASGENSIFCADASLLAVYPGYRNGTVLLGTSTYPWKNLYSNTLTVNTFEILQHSSGNLVFGSVGQSSAKGISVGSLLVSSAWADYTKVPTNGIYSKGQIKSGVAQGTAPFVVDSSTVVSKLNADLLDGKHATDFANASHDHYRLLATDDRDVIPSATSVVSPIKGIQPFFVQLSNYTVDTGTKGNFGDMLVLDTYTDATGGNPNALVVDKNNFNIWHFNGTWNGNSWNTGKRLAYYTETLTALSWDNTNNKLKWSKGGTEQTALTIGYASNADLLDGLHAKEIRIPLVIGTQTAATGTWTGSLKGTGVTELYDGLTINYYLPYAGSGNATLNLVLDTTPDTSTGAINCYYGGSTRLTTHYGAGTVFTLTYFSAGSIKISGTATTDNRWIAKANYVDGTESYTVRYNGFTPVVGYAADGTTSQTLYRYKLYMFDVNGCAQAVTLTDGTGTTKVINQVPLRISTGIYFYNYTTAKASGATLQAAYSYKAAYTSNFAYTHNGLSNLQVNKPIYLKGTPVASNPDLFVLDNTTATSFITQTVPTTEDGFIYVMIGYPYSSASYVQLMVENKAYWFKDGVFRVYDPSHSTIDKIRINAATAGDTPIEIYNVGDTDRYIKFGYDAVTTNQGASWRIGMQGTGTSDTNYFAIQSGTAVPGATSWNSVVRFGQNTYDAGFAGNVYPITNNTKTLGTSSLKWANVYATTFTGNLSGNATTATKLGTATVGSIAKPIYLNAGTPIAISATAGANNLPVYLNSGTITAVTSVGEAYLSWGGKNFSGTYGCVDAAMIGDLGANRTAFLGASFITIEYSRNNGSTWIDTGATDAQKANLFNGVGQSFVIGNATSGSLDTVATNQYQLRVTISTAGANLYTILNKFAIYISTSGTGGNTCSIQGRLQSNVESDTNTWYTFAEDVPISGWSGWNIINNISITTYGNTKTSQYGQIRFIFKCTTGSTDSRYAGLNIKKILSFGGQGWTCPSNMAKNGHLYGWDWQQNATFPGTIEATGFNVNGTAVSLSGHTHTSANITAMTGYTIASTFTAVTASDSLNTAIGKLSKAVDGVEALLAAI